MRSCIHLLLIALYTPISLCVTIVDPAWASPRPPESQEPPAARKAGEMGSYDKDLKINEFEMTPPAQGLDQAVHYWESTKLMDRLVQSDRL